MSGEVTILMIPAGDQMIRNGGDWGRIHLANEWFNTGKVQGWRTRCGHSFTVGGYKAIQTAPPVDDYYWCRNCVKHVVRSPS